MSEAGVVHIGSKMVAVVVAGIAFGEEQPNAQRSQIDSDLQAAVVDECIRIAVTVSFNAGIAVQGLVSLDFFMVFTIAEPHGVQPVGSVMFDMEIVRYDIVWPYMVVEFGDSVGVKLGEDDVVKAAELFVYGMSFSIGLRAMVRFDAWAKCEVIAVGEEVSGKVDGV